MKKKTIAIGIIIVLVACVTIGVAILAIQKGGVSMIFTKPEEVKMTKVSKIDDTITVKATGYATGTSTIKVAMNDGSGKTATCKVTVKNPVSKLSIAPEAGRTDILRKVRV